MNRRCKSNVFHDIYDRPYFDVGLARMKLYKSSKNSLGMVQRLNLLKRLPVHNGCVNSISWNERGEYILSGSDDQHITITNGFNYKVMAKVKTSHRANIFSAKFLPGRGDCHIISCSGDGIILYTDLNRPELTSMNQFSCHSGTTYDVVTVPNDPHSFLSCGEDGTVRWFDLRIKEKCRKTSCKEDILILCERAVTSLSVNPIAPYQLAVGCADSRVRLYDRRMLGTVAAGYPEATRTSHPLSTFTVPALKERSCRITSLNYSPDGEEVLVSFSSDLLYLFAMNDRTNISNNATVEDCNIEGPSTDRSPAPVRRLRLRGDWSDTGPNARPERDGGTREPGEMTQTRRTLHSSLMQRMTDVLSRMLNDPATRANLNGGRQPSRSQDPQPEVVPDEAVPSSSGTSDSPAPTVELPRSPVFPFDHPLNESFSVNPFLPFEPPPSPETDDATRGVVYVTRTVPDDDQLDSPMSPEDLTSAASSVQPGSPMLQDPSPEDVALASQPEPEDEVFDMSMSAHGDDHANANLAPRQAEANGNVDNLPMLPNPTQGECTCPVSSDSQAPRFQTCNNRHSVTGDTSCETQPTETTTVHDTGPSNILCVCSNGSSNHDILTPATSISEESHSVPVSSVEHNSANGRQTPSPTPDQLLPSSSTNQTLDNRLEESSTASDAPPPPPPRQPSSSNRVSVIVRGPGYTGAPGDLTNGDVLEYEAVPASEGNVILELVASSSRSQSDVGSHRFTLGDPEAKMRLVDPQLDENFRRDSPLSPPVVSTESIAVQATDRSEAMSEDDTDGASDNSGHDMEVESDSSVDGDTQQFPRVMYPRPRQVMIPPGDLTQLRNNEDLIDTLHSMRHRHATEPAVLLSVSNVTETGAAFAVRLAPETNRGPPDIPFLSQNQNVLQAQVQDDSASVNSPSTDQNETSRGSESDESPPHRVIHPIEKEMEDAMEGARTSRVRSEEERSFFQPSVKQVFSGHRNARTMIKEACFWGTDYVMSGSDCGHVFVWDRSTGQLVQLFEADDHVVNCLQPHPTLPILATSGIDYDIKLWAPLASDSTFDVALADMLKKRNEIMLEETKDTITVPATFMIRMLACLNQIRRGGRRPQRQPDEESNE